MDRVLCQRAREVGGYQRIPRRIPTGGFPDSGVRPKPIYSWMPMNHGDSLSNQLSDILGHVGTLSPSDSDSVGPDGTLSSSDLAGILFLAVPAGIPFPVGPVGPVGMLSPPDSDGPVGPDGALSSSDLV